LEEAAGLGVGVEKITLSQYDIKPCLGHEVCASYKKCLQNDDTALILDSFREADGVILATPVYYYNVSAQMKAFIDRNYFIYKKEQQYKARAAGIIVVAEKEGIEETLVTLELFAKELAVAEGKLFVASGYASLIGDIKKNPQLIEDARKLGRKMAQNLQCGC
jgi:multimeric flavodoxin WrbA